MSTSVAPSAFSSLLRRSKFASYDPAINQAYTSYGGFAYRGHWGTKRDLPPKRKHKVPDPLVSSSGGRGSARRNPVAFIAALDSAEGQTEWKSAEKDVRWLRRLEELGSGTHLNDMSAWSKRVGSSGGRVIGDVDSEFGSADSAKNSSQQMTSALPNTQAMSERQFKSYIAKLRAQRADFHEFLQKNGVAQPEEGSKLQSVPMYALAQEPTTYHTRFLAHKNQEAAVQPTSSTLTPLPHPSGGLDYLNPTPLMSQLLYPNPVRGRYIQPPDNKSSRFGPGQKYESHALVSIAGNSANLVQDESSAAVRPVDWHKLVERNFSQPLEQPTSVYRVERVELFQVPGVVGKSRQNIEGADIRIRARDWSKRQQDRPNPHRPGTFKYASHEDTRTTDNTPVSMRANRSSSINSLESTGQREESSQAMMSLLDTLLAAAPNPDKKT